MKNISPDKLKLITSKFREHLAEWKDLDLSKEANLLLDFIESNDKIESGDYTILQIPGTEQFKVFKTKLGQDSFLYVGSKDGCLLFTNPPETKEAPTVITKTIKTKISGIFNPFK